MEDRNLYFTDMDGEDCHTGSDSGKLGSKSIPLTEARNIGVGSKKAFVCVELTEALAGGGKTLDVDLVTADDEEMSVNLAAVKLTAIQFPAASAIDSRDYFEIPESFAYQDFIDVRFYARGSGAPTTGKARARITLEPGVRHLYTSGSSLG